MFGQHSSLHAFDFFVYAQDYKDLPEFEMLVSDVTLTLALALGPNRALALAPNRAPTRTLTRSPAPPLGRS